MVNFISTGSQYAIIVVFCLPFETTALRLSRRRYRILNSFAHDMMLYLVSLRCLLLMYLSPARSVVCEFEFAHPPLLMLDSPLFLYVPRVPFRGRALPVAVDTDGQLILAVSYHCAGTIGH
jgi:hypothetical protein